MTPSIPRASSVGRLAITCLALAGLACSGGGKASPYPDGSTATGGRAGSGGTSGTGGASAGTGGASTGTGGAGGAGALPAPLHILPGPSALLGPGISCSFTPTTTPPATGAKPDQWCGVITPGAAANTIALFVFNLTKAMAGTTVTCAAGDPNCIGLSTSISTATPPNPGFFGQTLIYYEATAAFAWRPGWTAPRMLLTQDQPVFCAGTSNAATAICLKQNATDTTVESLYAGVIDTQAGGVLPLVESISAAVGGLNFSPDGLSVLWSTAVPATSPEILKIQTIGDSTTRRTVASNVTSWTLTPDGMRWLWLSQPVTDANMLTTGVLQTATYPIGGAPTDVQTAVLDYAPWSAKGVFVLSSPGTVGADIKAISDVTAPTTTSRTLATQTAFGLIDLTPAGNLLFFDNAVTDPTNANGFLTNLRAVKSDGTGACAVSATPLAPQGGAAFTTNGLGVAWTRNVTSTLGVTTSTGIVTLLSGCGAHTFSTSPSGYADVGSGLVLIENFDTTAGTGALGFSPFAADGTPGATIAIEPAADFQVFPLFPDVPRVVYAVIQTGIYVSASLTGTTSPAPPQAFAASSGGPIGAATANATSLGARAGVAARTLAVARASLAGPLARRALALAPGAAGLSRLARARAALAAARAMVPSSIPATRLPTALAR